MAKGSYCHAKGSDLFTGGVGGPIKAAGPYSTVRYKFNDAAQLTLTDILRNTTTHPIDHVAKLSYKVEVVRLAHCLMEPKKGLVGIDFLGLRERSLPCPK